MSAPGTHGAGRDAGRAFVEAVRGGLIPAVPVPFDADGRIDWAAHERYVERMAGERVRGVALWAHTGRGLLLEADQRRDVLLSWRRGFRRPIVAGVGAR